MDRLFIDGSAGRRRFLGWYLVAVDQVGAVRSADHAPVVGEQRDDPAADRLFPPSRLRELREFCVEEAHVAADRHYDEREWAEAVRAYDAALDCRTSEDRERLRLVRRRDSAHQRHERRTAAERRRQAREAERSRRASVTRERRRYRERQRRVRACMVPCERRGVDIWECSRRCQQILNQ